MNMIGPVMLHPHFTSCMHSTFQMMSIQLSMTEPKKSKISNFARQIPSLAVVNMNWVQETYSCTYMHAYVFWQHHEDVHASCACALSMFVCCTVNCVGLLNYVFTISWIVCVHSSLWSCMHKCQDSSACCQYQLSELCGTCIQESMINSNYNMRQKPPQTTAHSQSSISHQHNVTKLHDHEELT